MRYAVILVYHSDRNQKMDHQQPSMSGLANKKRSRAQEWEKSHILASLTDPCGEVRNDLLIQSIARQRSVALISINRRALQLPYPDDKRWKLYIRKVESAVASRSPKLHEAINEAEQWIVEMSSEDSFRNILRDKLNSIKASNAKTIKKSKVQRRSERYCPKIDSVNSEVPCASDAITIKYNELYGRHIVATRKIYPEECRLDALKSHQDVECFMFPVLTKLQFTNQDLFGVKLVIEALNEHKNIQNLRKELKEVDNNNDPRTKGFYSDGKLHSDKYRSVYSLETNTEKRSVSDMFMRTIDTCYILYILATCTSMFGNVSINASQLAKNHDVTFIGGLILKHQQIIPTNSHSLHEERGLEGVTFGLAALPFLSFLNHSCSANTSRFSTSECTVIIAIYPIEKNEQLYDNYGQHYAISKRAVRQQRLLKQYCFNCACVPCRQDWPLFYQLGSYESLVTDFQVKRKIRTALKKFPAYVTLAEKDDMENQETVIKDLLPMIQILYDNVPLPCEEMAHVVETLIRVYAFSGNRFDIPKI
ncbi:hypothetical protein KM043_010191 [Ampulex compressa]|nr:hypothetical protein KM043_010191 [Ampulex compressa]